MSDTLIIITIIVAPLISNKKNHLDHLQLRELELHKLSWGKFTREFKLTDKGTQQRAKIEQQLSSPSQSTIPNLHA